MRVYRFNARNLRDKPDKRTGNEVRAEHESLNNYRATRRNRVAGNV